MAEIGSEDLARMWSERPEIIRTFLEQRHAYELLCNEIQYILSRRLVEGQIEISAVTSRAKSLRSFAEKVFRKDYKNPLRDVTDIAGARVVYLYRGDRAKIEVIIEREFQVIERVDKGQLRNVDEFGYGALHYLVRLGESSSGARYDDLKHFICEIQVRTVVQDSWAIIDHHLSYKHETDVPQELRRKLNALSGLFSTADDQFEAIRDEREQYIKSVRRLGARKFEFLNQELNLDTFREYLKWKFPKKTEGEDIFIARVFRGAHKCGVATLAQLDIIVERSKSARAAMNKEKRAPSAASEVNRALCLVCPHYRTRVIHSAEFKALYAKYENKVKPS